MASGYFFPGCHAAVWDDDRRECVYLRAVTMFLIEMGARITGRIYDMPSAVSVTAMMILAESPAYLLDSGFLLSFGCVLGICVASERICALAGAKRKGTKFSVNRWLFGW